MEEENCGNREDHVARNNSQDCSHQRAPFYSTVHFELSTNVLPSLSWKIAAVPQSAFCGFVTNSTPLLSSSRTVPSTSSAQNVIFIFVPGWSPLSKWKS